MGVSEVLFILQFILQDSHALVVGLNHSLNMFFIK